MSDDYRFQHAETVRLQVGWLAWCPRSKYFNAAATTPNCRLLQANETFVYLGTARDNPEVAWVKDHVGVQWRVPNDLLIPAG